MIRRPIPEIMSTLARIQTYRAAIPVAALSTLFVFAAAPIHAQQRGGNQSPPPDTLNDPVRLMVARLDLEKYKATIKGLTQFGDRRQGTERNRKAVDWIEAQLKSYGCTTTERIKYIYTTPPRQGRGGAAGDSAGARGRGGAAGDSAGGRGRGRGNAAQGGGRMRGIRTQTGVNTDSLKQPDPRIRALDAEPATDGPREEVFCTKVGTTHPEEMYIVGGHMDGHGWDEAANDDGSGTALVMELARVFSSPDVKTDRSIRFVLWNNEETGTNGARAYVAQRDSLQGKENPPGSGKYPEPKWLGMIQHDMMMFDHGMPRPDGTMSPDQRPEADVNIEFAGDVEVGRGRAETRVVLPDGEREVRDRLSGARRAAHDEHGLRTLPGPRAGDLTARERAWLNRSARAGIRSGTSRRISTRRTATRISGSA